MIQRITDTDTWCNNDVLINYACMRYNREWHWDISYMLPSSFPPFPSLFHSLCSSPSLHTSPSFPLLTSFPPCAFFLCSTPLSFRHSLYFCLLPPSQLYSSLFWSSSLLPSGLFSTPRPQSHSLCMPRSIILLHSLHMQPNPFPAEEAIALLS